jgi:hypothetical protein
MKRIFCIFFLLVVAATGLRAQTRLQFDHVKLTNKKDYKLADTTVSQLSAYLLSIPINRDTTTRINGAQFLMKWMEGTNEYTFVVNENNTRAFINNINLMAVYMAALCKTALQHKPGTDSKTITIDGTKRLISYINDPANNVKMTPELRELCNASDKGELESFLNF